MAAFFFGVFYVQTCTGDPLTAYYGDRVEKMSVEERWQAEEKLGLHDRIFTQYVRWGRKALQGDFGISYKYKENVLAVIGEKLPNTLLLGGTGFFLVFVCSLFLGAFCAEREEKWQDRAALQSWNGFRLYPGILAFSAGSFCVQCQSEALTGKRSVYARAVAAIFSTD